MKITLALSLLIGFSCFAKDFIQSTKIEQRALHITIKGETAKSMFLLAKYGNLNLAGFEQILDRDYVLGENYTCTFFSNKGFFCTMIAEESGKLSPGSSAETHLGFSSHN